MAEPIAPGSTGQLFCRVSARGFSTPRKQRKRRILSRARQRWAHLGTTTKSARKRSAAVCGAPAAAARRGHAFWDHSATLGIRTCCGWSFGHSRGPVVVPRCAGQRFGGESLLYIRCLRRKPDLLVMDTILSLLNGDLSIWGVIAMPIGVAICFGPALAVWLKEEMRGGDGEKKEDHRKPIQKQ